MTNTGKISPRHQPLLEQPWLYSRLPFSCRLSLPRNFIAFRIYVSVIFYSAFCDRLVAIAATRFLFLLTVPPRAPDKLVLLSEGLP
jgi:hypothetical protein